MRVNSHHTSTFIASVLLLAHWLCLDALGRWLVLARRRLQHQQQKKDFPPRCLMGSYLQN